MKKSHLSQRHSSLQQLWDTDLDGHTCPELASVPSLATSAHSPCTSVGLPPQSPFSLSYTHSREVAVVVTVYSWGGTRQTQWFSPSNSTIRPRAGARALDSLFLKWQSLLNINDFQTFFQPSFLTTIYSVIQLFANLLNPKKSHTGQIKHWSSPHSACSTPARPSYSLHIRSFILARAF